MYITFIDLKIAFDKVNRRIMLNKLRKIGIEGKMLRIIKEIYRRTYNKIKTELGLTEEFVTKKSVKQGYPLNTTLFNIFLQGNPQK